MDVNHWDVVKVAAPVLTKNFERLAEEAGLAKPLVKSRVPELAESVIGNLGKVEAGNPVAEGVVNLIKKRSERTRDSVKA